MIKIAGGKGKVKRKPLSLPKKKKPAKKK